MIISVRKMQLAFCCAIIMLYLRIPPPQEEEEEIFTLSLRLDHDIEQIREEIESHILDTTPFDPDTLINPFFRYREIFKVLPKYSLSTCQIEKTGCLLKEAIFCFLKNPWKFEANNRRISTEEYFSRLCKDDPYSSNYSYVRRSLGRTRFVVVRDPLERFLSGFVDKCIMRPKDVETRCFACLGKLDCFVEAFYKKLQEVYNTRNDSYHFEVAHMAPQTWYCDFKEHLHDYIFVKYKNGPNFTKSIALQFDQVFEAAGVPEYLRRVIRKEILVGRTPHTTRDNAARNAAEDELFRNQTLFNLVIRMFYYDYKVFGFPLPNGL